MQKDGSPSFPSTAPANNNKLIRSFHLLLVCTNLLRSSHFWLHSSAASFPGASGPLACGPSSSWRWFPLGFSDLPLDLCTSSQGSIFRPAALSQSPALCYFAIGDRTVFLIVVHAIALEMSVIISGQLLTLLLGGTFLPSISLQFWMSPLTGNPPWRGRVEIKVTGVKRNTIRFRKLGCSS